MIKYLAIAVFCIGASFGAPQAYAADKNLTCAQITAEVEELNAIVTAAGTANVSDSAAGAAAAAGTQAAIMSGAGSSVPFIGGAFNIAKSVTNANKENAVKNADKAEKRIIKLETISDMKGC